MKHWTVLWSTRRKNNKNVLRKSAKPNYLISMFTNAKIAEIVCASNTEWRKCTNVGESEYDFQKFCFYFQFIFNMN